MADIPYGTDYPDAPWIDRDGHVLIDDGGKPTQVHRGQARIAYRLAERYQDKLLHVAGIGWHSWDGRRWAADDRGKPNVQCWQSCAKRSQTASTTRNYAPTSENANRRPAWPACSTWPPHWYHSPRR